MAKNTLMKNDDNDAVNQLAKMLMEKINDSVNETVTNEVSKPIAELKDDQKDLRAHVEKLETRTTLEYDEQRLIQREANHRISRLLGADNFKKYAPTFYGHLYSGLKNKFCVPSYRAIRRTDLEDAKEFIREWEPIGGVQDLKDVIDERGETTK